MSASQGFQTQAYYNPAPGVEGDFASTNPRATVLAGPGGLIAGDNGLVVGRFAWTTDEFVDADGAPAVANNYGAGPVAGFVHREQQGLITVYLEEATMLVPKGFPVTVFDGGDFWVKNNGSAQALPGMKAYANFADGTATFAASGAASGGTSSASTIAAETSSSTGSISGNVLTVTAVASGTIYPGTVISGTNVATGTQIVEQLLPLETGEAVGGIGRYSVSIPEQTVASTAISGGYGLLTVGGTLTGSFGPGDTLSGTGVTAGTTIWQQLTGTTGGAGTYVVSPSQTVSSGAINSATNVETKWVCRSSGLPGEIVKISSWPQG
jgi:hypothetical protein